MILAPIALEEEVAEVEAPDATRAAVQARHTAVAAAIFPEPIRLIEGSITFAFRQLVALLFENQGQTLRAGMNGVLGGEKIHSFLWGGRSADVLLEHTDTEFVAGLQNSARIREVLVGNIVVIEIEWLLFTALVLLVELDELGRVVIVSRHRDDAEIDKQGELWGWRLQWSLIEAI